MLSMAEEFATDSLFWDDDQSWAFPVLASQENGGKLLIEGGKILTDAGGSGCPQTEKRAPAAKGKKSPTGVSASKRGVDDQGNEGNSGGGETDDHELHIWTERERRKKMRNMFASLHALIPNIHPRADKSTIVDEAIVHIKNLEQTLDNLRKLKRENHRLAGNTKPTCCDPSTVTPPTQSREAFLAEQGSTSQQAVTLPSPSPLFPGPELPATFKTWTSPNVILNICGLDAHINICCPKKPGLLTAVSFVMEKYKLGMVSGQVSSYHGTRMYMIHARANGGPHQTPEALFLVQEIYKQAAAEIMLWLNS